ncbi:hypothetical protein GCM10027348_35330 [Hymenobacter tenuis]
MFPLALYLFDLKSTSPFKHLNPPGLQMELVGTRRHMRSNLPNATRPHSAIRARSRHYHIAAARLYHHYPGWARPIIGPVVGPPIPPIVWAVKRARRRIPIVRPRRRTYHHRRLRARNATRQRS